MPFITRILLWHAQRHHVKNGDPVKFSLEHSRPLERPSPLIKWQNIWIALTIKLATTFLSITWHRYTTTSTALDEDDEDIDIAALIVLWLLFLIEKIDTDKSWGLNVIKSRVVKDTQLFPHKKLCAIFRNSFNEGIFVASWSCAT